MQSCILAVDIGASSGRHIVGTVQKGKLVLREVYRFENGVHRQNGHLCWDIEALAREVMSISSDTAMMGQTMAVK